MYISKLHIFKEYNVINFDRCIYPLNHYHMMTMNIYHLQQFLQALLNPFLLPALNLGKHWFAFCHYILVCFFLEFYMNGVLPHVLFLGLVIFVFWSLSHVQLFAVPWTAAHQASLSITNSWSLLKLMSIESVMPSNHLILCHPHLLLFSIFPSIRVLSSELALCIRWPEYWSFSFSISPSNEYSGLISFRIDWLDLLSVQGTLKSLLQHHSSKAFFGTQPSLWSSSHIHTCLLEKP